MTEQNRRADDKRAPGQLQWSETSTSTQVATRTDSSLFRQMADAGAAVLDYMGVAGAISRIENTEPPRYVMAGTLSMIAGMAEKKAGGEVAPASADNPSTAGAATIDTDKFRELMLHWHLAEEGEPSKVAREKLIEYIHAHFAAPVAQSTAGAAKGQKVVRYCPGCGSVGPVESKYRDCCPDGNVAFDVPEEFAKQCHGTFSLALRTLAAPALNPSEARAVALEEVAQFFEMQDGSQASKKEMGIAAKLARLLATKPAGWAQQRTEDAASKEGGAA